MAYLHAFKTYLRETRNQTILQIYKVKNIIFVQDTTENVFFNVTNEPIGINITEYRLNR